MPGFSHFRFSLPTARNLVSFGANKPVLLLSNVTNLIDDFDGCLGKKTTASTTTLSSPQPQAGATSGRLTKALLSTLVAGPQETTCSCSTLPAGLATPGGFGASIPSFNLAGMFGCVDFEILFNVLVILGVIYLLFTPPVEDDTTADESFDVVDITLPRGSELDSPEAHSCCSCHSTTGTTEPSRPRKTRPSSRAKQPVATASSTASLRNPPVGISPALYTPHPTGPAQPTNTTTFLAQVEHEATVSRTEPAVDMVQAARPDSRGTRSQWDMDAPIINGNGSAQTSASSSSAPAINRAGPSIAPNKPHNPETATTIANVRSKVGKGKGKEAIGVVTEHRLHAGPLPVGKPVPSRKVEVQTLAIHDSNVDPRPQPLTAKRSGQTQRPAPPPTPRQVFIPQPAVDVSFPVAPVGPIHVIVPMDQDPPPVIPVPVQLPLPATLPTVPPSWIQQQIVIGPSSYLPAQAVLPITITPLPYAAQLVCAPVVVDRHESGPDQDMDITDDDGDTWMRPSMFGEAATLLPGPAPAPLTQTLMILLEDAPQHTHGDGSTQPSTVIVPRAPTPVLGPTRGTLDLSLCKKLRTSRLPYGVHPSVAPLAPSVNRWARRLRGGVELGRGFTDAHRSVRNKNIARASLLHKRSLLRKKVATRPPKPQHLDNPIPPHVDDQPKATDPVPVAPVDLPSSQKRKRTYYDRLHATRASPYSQRGPSEVSLLAYKEVPKSASLRKAFIWQCHLAARDRRAAGTDGRISVIYQDDPITSQQAVAGSRQQPAPSQRKAPVGDRVYPRRKRPTAADFIRVEDAEKEKEALDATVDALQSMGLKPEVSIPAPLSYALAPDAPESSSIPSSSSVVQDPEFNQDQAQLLLEDFFEDFEKNQNSLVSLLSPSLSLSDSSSDLDSEPDDD